MSKHNSSGMAQQLCATQRNEAACRAALIQAQESVKRQAAELEKVTFDRNYWRDRAETQEQTIELLQRKLDCINNAEITINIHK